jgi:hypothetical protein
MAFFGFVGEAARGSSGGRLVGSIHERMQGALPPDTKFLRSPEAKISLAFYK